jgi:peptide/nickel transport system permease protein
MSSYIGRRLLLIIPTLFIASTLIFVAIRVIPGSAVDIMTSRLMDVLSGDAVVIEDVREAIRHELGLDVPIHIQYVRWLGGILRGDLGIMMWEKKPVTDRLIERFPITFELGVLSVLIALLISFPIGIYSALRQDSWGDYVSRSFAILIICLPSFWVATLVLVFLSLWLGWSPPLEYVSFFENPRENLTMFILPALIMGALLSGVNMRMLRATMLEVLRQDYIRTAWSKGLKERAIIPRHALSNAVIPVVTIFGLQLPHLLGGAVIIETIFGLPGWGRMLYTAALERDYTTLMGTALVMGIIVLFINLSVDLSYAFLDPRIRYQ